MTLREIDIYARGWNARKEREWEDTVSIARLTAQLIRAKKVPKLEELLPKPETKEDRAKRIRERLDMWAKQANKEEKRRRKLEKKNG